MTMTATATTILHRIIHYHDEPRGDGAGTTTRAVSLLLITTLTIY